MILILIAACYLLLLLTLVYFLRGHKLFLTVVIIAVSIGVKIFIVQAYKIPAGSMKPTLLIGDHILANKYVYRFKSPQRGELVIFPLPEKPEADFIKRVVGIGGDVIEIKDKTLYLNGNLLSEPYVIHSDTRTQANRDFFGPAKIPDDSIFVLGDNRDHSYDSRFWGNVKTSSVKARAEVIYWSYDKKTQTVRWDRVGSAIR